MENHNNQNLGVRIWAIIATLLFLLAAGAAYKFWTKSTDLETESIAQEKQYAILQQEKLVLEHQLDSLNLAYTDLRTENDELEGAVGRAENLVIAKAGQIEEIRRKTSGDVAGLRAQVAALQEAKTELETVLAILRAENDQLKAENARLAGENSQLKGEKDVLNTQVGDLSQKLEDQIRKTQSARFKASAFRVEVEKRGDRLTTKAKKVREINVSFDLADVPQNYQGTQKLYLSITDDKGVPIPSINPEKTTIEAPSGSIQVIAQQSRAVSIGDTQRLSFTYKLDEKLQKGSYIAAIYCDKGLLGVSSFKLL